jgi:hypothetical protein
MVTFARNPAKRLLTVRLTGLSVLAFTLVGMGCRDGKLHVERITAPEYPLAARLQNLQGIVLVRVSIGPDGKVVYAKGSGGPDVLVKAAEENAQMWIFGPFPPVCEFPIEHTIQYTYKLEGKPKVVALTPVLKTFLPDRVEITAVPLVSDYPPIEEYRPVSKKK